MPKPLRIWAKSNSKREKDSSSDPRPNIAFTMGTYIKEFTA